MSEEELRVSIKYGEIEAEFRGSPGAVYREVVAFLEKTIPAYSLARKLSYSVGLQELLDRLSHILAYDEVEGLSILENLSAIPVSDAILLIALRNYLEHGLGRLESPTINYSELIRALPRKSKTISSSLTGLVQSGLLRRLDRGDYTITKLGLKHLMERFGRGETKG